MWQSDVEITLGVMKLCPVLWPLVAMAFFPAYAAEVSIACDSKFELATRGCTIRLTGAIVPGDAERLRKQIREPLYGDWSYRVLLLDSPGGDVPESIKIAEVVRSALLETSTYRFPDDIRTAEPENYACISACFLVWVAGTTRSSMSAQLKGGRTVGLGLHRPYFSTEAYNNSPAKVAEAQQSIMASVRAYLRREQVPERFVELMLERSSREIYWLHETGDSFALDGRAPWFEEMMIARCNFDPEYDRKSQARGIALVEQRKRPQADAAYSAYLVWRQNYNSCEYEVRRQSQAAMRK